MYRFLCRFVSVASAQSVFAHQHSAERHAAGCFEEGVRQASVTPGIASSHGRPAVNQNNQRTWGGPSGVDKED